MKSRLSKIGIGIALIGLMGWSTAHAQSTGQVYQITISGSGIHSKDISSNQQVLVKDKITTAAIINLARGRAPEALVPTNEVLALVLTFGPGDGQPTGNIVVWDTLGQGTLVTLVNLQSVGGAIETKKSTGFVAIVGTLPTVGHFTGGWLAMSGKATVTNPDTAPILTKFKASALQGELNGNDGTNDFDVLITKGKVTLGLLIGTVITS